MDVISQRLKTNERSIAFIFLIDDIRVFKMVFKLGRSLYPCITDLANFSRIKFVPFVVVEFLVKLLDEFRMDKIDESITNIAVVLSLSINTL